MGVAPTTTPMELSTWVSGKTISTMAKEESSGLMVLITMDNILTDIKVDVVVSNGTMALNMKVNLLRTIWMVKARMCGRMVVSMWDSGSTTICTDQVSSRGPTVRSSRANITRTRRLVMGSSRGPMGVLTRASGRMAYNLGKERWPLMVHEQKAYGKMVC